MALEQVTKALLRLLKSDLEFDTTLETDESVHRMCNLLYDNQGVMNRDLALVCEVKSSTMSIWRRSTSNEAGRGDVAKKARIELRKILKEIFIQLATEYKQSLAKDGKVTPNIQMPKYLESPIINKPRNNSSFIRFFTCCHSSSCND